MCCFGIVARKEGGDETSTAWCPLNNHPFQELLHNNFLVVVVLRYHFHTLATLDKRCYLWCIGLILGILLDRIALWKNIIDSFWYQPQGQLQAQEGVVKFSPEALALTVLKLLSWILVILFNILASWKTSMIVPNTSLRASFRLMQVLENAVLRPWHQQFWSF